LISDIACFVLHQKLHHDLIAVVHCRRLCKSPNILRGRKENVVVAANHVEVATTCRWYVLML
jgi:hypothetical protein